MSSFVIKTIPKMAASTTFHPAAQIALIQFKSSTKHVCVGRALALKRVKDLEKEVAALKQKIPVGPPKRTVLWPNTRLEIVNEQRLKEMIRDVDNGFVKPPAFRRGDTDSPAFVSPVQWRKYGKYSPSRPESTEVINFLRAQKGTVVKKVVISAFGDRPDFAKDVGGVPGILRELCRQQIIVVAE